MSYSRKVFIPLTQLCRDVCHYCTFAKAPRAARARLSVAGRGAGDRPRRRGGRLHGGAVHARRQAGAALPRGARGAGGARPRDDDRLPARDVRAGAARDRPAAARQSRRDDARRRSRRCARSPPARGSCWSPPASGCASRAACITARRTSTRRCGWKRCALAGELRVPFTTGILIGIGETRARADRGAARDPRPARARTATSRKSSSRISAPSPARRWRGAPEPDARRPAVDDRRRAPDPRRRT